MNLYVVLIKNLISTYEVLCSIKFFLLHKIIVD